MQQSLFLFVLMGPCYVMTHKNYEYHFIEEQKTWTEAQQYCRESYTDLAVVNDEDDVVRLLQSTDYRGEAWIGPHSEGGDLTNECKCSDGSSSTFTNWDSENPTSFSDNLCTLTLSNNGGKWGTAPCDAKNTFFCYDDKVILIKQEKTWEEALNYCRENHRDLVTITSPHQQRWVQERAKQASTVFIWMGLKYTCFLDLWFWVSDEAVSYKNWAENGRYDQCDMSGAMESQGHNEWYSQSEKDKKFNFICMV